MVIRSHPLPKGLDPLKASDQELVRHGVPPRPKDSTLLSEWENLMKRLGRSTFIEPKFRRTDRRRGPVIRSGTQTWNNWSGGIVFLPPNSPAGAKFYVVAGQWTVPNALPGDADDQLYYCSSWIGLDGEKPSVDILQAGVECEVQFTSSGVAQTIYPWLEWLPENEIQITNLAVSVGDLLVCNITSNSSTTATIVLSNSTNNQWTAFDVTAPTGTTLVGNCAEWIVERPNFGGLTQLANYDSVTFQEAFGGTNLPGSDAVRDPREGDAINMTGDNGVVISTGTVKWTPEIGPDVKV
jgi:hypothetical protein